MKQSNDRPEIDQLIVKMEQGSVRSMARLISRVERDDSDARYVVKAIFAMTGQAHVVGITGPPGAGKSSLVAELVTVLRAQEKKVAVLAVDPSSPFTGGALLGDRVRMQQLTSDKGVFIRSLASRGNLGGLSASTGTVTKILDAAGFDMILLETVGAGQAEIAIAEQAHTTLLIEAPGMGDDVQSIKAGILEVADIIVVNKADKPGASRTVKSLESMLSLGPTGGTRHHGRIVDAPDVVAARAADAWPVPVLKTSALHQTGVEALVEEIHTHRTHLITHNLWIAREADRMRLEIMQMLMTRFKRLIETEIGPSELNDFVEMIISRERDPYTTVDLLFERLIDQPSR